MEALTGEMENKILDAATRVFVRKGKTGTSMQDIADEAGINRPLLNYYFRSKERLFDQVFYKVFIRFLPDVAKVFNSNLPISEKLSKFIDTYTEMLNQSPLTPIFILNEVATNPGSLVEAIRKMGIDPVILFKQIEDEMQKGILKKDDPRQIMVNMLAMVIFPYAARPMLEHIMFGGNSAEVDLFMEKRNVHLKEFFIRSIKA